MQYTGVYPSQSTEGSIPICCNIHTMLAFSGTLQGVYNACVGLLYHKVVATRHNDRCSCLTLLYFSDFRDVEWKLRNKQEHHRQEFLSSFVFASSYKLTTW